VLLLELLLFEPLLLKLETVAVEDVFIKKRGIQLMRVLSWRLPMTDDTVQNPDCNDTDKMPEFMAADTDADKADTVVAADEEDDPFLVLGDSRGDTIGVEWFDV
jgi:hypothetical protein